MQPILLLVAALLGIAGLTFVLSPLYRHPVSEVEMSAETETKKLGDREQNARQALSEVEFDFQLGNLDQEDYRDLRSLYMRRALLEMKNRQQRSQEIDDEIEKQLLQLKTAQPSAAEETEGEEDA